MYLHTLEDRQAEAFINAVDVVVRLHDPTDPSTERMALPSSAHVQLDDNPGLRSSKVSGMSSVSTTAW